MRNVVYVNPWTPERLENLKKLIDLHWSGSEIGTVLGIGRNAVIGKANRMGWPLNSRGWPPKKSRRRPRRQKLTLTMWGNRDLPMPRSPPILPPALPQAVSNHPAPLHIGIFELTHEHCRWPHGVGPPFTYCGHPRSRTSTLWFCDYHVKTAT